MRLFLSFSGLASGLWFLAALGTPAHANDTALHDGRFGPEPLPGESPVRMMREHLEVVFGARETRVHCTFTFRNVAAVKTVAQQVGFPDIGAALDEIKKRDPEKADVLGERVNTTRLQDMRTLVDGRERLSKLVIGEVPAGAEDDGTIVWRFQKADGGVRAWHALEIEFPPQQDVKVERIYTARNGTTMPGIAFFQYTTRTGGVWQGTIGQMKTDVTLADELKVEDLVWPGTMIHGHKITAWGKSFAVSPARSSWQVIDDQHLRLVWNDFEPRTEPQHRGFTLAREWHGWED